MKNIILLIILFFFGFINAQDNSKIIGEWKATDFFEKESKFIFSKEGYISLTINGEFVNGKNYIIKGGKDNGQKAEVKYLIDYNKVPIELDIFVIKKEKGKLEEIGRFFGALKFLNDQEALLILTKEKRVDFDEENKDRTIRLQKVN